MYFPGTLNFIVTVHIFMYSGKDHIPYHMIYKNLCGTEFNVLSP